MNQQQKLWTNTTRYLTNTYKFKWYIIDINGKELKTDINDRCILDMLIFNEFMLEQPNLFNIGSTKNLYMKMYNILNDFYDITRKISYNEKRKEIKAKMEFIECIKQFRTICDMVYEYLDNELDSSNEIHDFIQVMDFMSDIGDGNTESSDYDMDEIYNYIQKDMLKFIQLVYIWYKNEDKEKKAILKIENYYLNALYSPYTKIGVKRLKKSMEELYE